MNEVTGYEAEQNTNYQDKISPSRKMDITLRQNIDARIAQKQVEIKALEETKSRMEKSGILDMRIDDIQAAMRF